MSIVLAKGEDFTGRYTVTGIEQASDWTGTASLYSLYPGGVVLLSVPLVYVPAVDLEPAFIEVSISLEDTLSLSAGMYYLVSVITSVSLGITVTKLDYVTLLAASNVTAAPMTVLTMTLVKADGTPAGKEIRTMVSNGDGTMSASISWDGVPVTVSNPTADALSGNIVDTEMLTVKTDPAGYAQAAVLRGLTVNVTCPYFGKSVTVDTTGLDTIDLSSYF